MARILCAMSGGVDSSVAAALLAKEGHEVIGVFLRLGEGADASTHNQRSCCSVNDAHDAARVADHLGIPFYALNYRSEFERIIDYFVDEYNLGRTPNPCARCNQWIKFGTLKEQARELECDSIASGHYARIQYGAEAGSARLLRGADTTKDQSYFLFTMPRDSLAVTLFPVGHLTKTEARDLARDWGLPVANKPDSQEICFVPGGDYRAVLRERSPESIRHGEMVDTEGKVIGDHEGHQNFTVGQRRGLGQAFGEPRYVVSIDAIENRVTLGSRAELGSNTFSVEEINWLSMPEPEAGSTLEAGVQIRHHGQAHPARLTVTGKGQAEVIFDASVDTVTPGQAAVFYDDDVLLGGGWIKSSKSAR